MRSLVVATQNPKKARELAELSRGRFAVRHLADVGLGALEVAETESTFAGNARLKAQAVFEALSEGIKRETFAIVADDSGIVVDALGTRPGVRSARFASDAGTGAGDDDNNALLLVMLDAVPDGMRGA